MSKRGPQVRTGSDSDWVPGSLVFVKRMKNPVAIAPGTDLVSFGRRTQSLSLPVLTWFIRLLKNLVHQWQNTQSGGKDVNIVQNQYL